MVRTACLLSLCLALCGLALAVPLGQTKEIRDVFIIPHSHCDAGWLQTVQGYYDSRVEWALTAVTEQLRTNPQARFVWAETVWFNMWWPHQPESVRDVFRKALQDGRIEFVGGGWVQNDEVNIPWRDVVEQTTTGHEYLRQELGDLAQVRWGWQLDMFAGYSAVTPTLWSKMGYDGMVIRFEGPDDERARFTSEKAFQFYWEGSPNLGDKAKIFTHCLQGNYGTMIGKNLNFEGGSPGLTPQNIEAQMQPLIEFLGNETVAFQGPLMELWGSDFHFYNASVMFGNMSMVIDWFNNRSDTLGYRLRLSTVSEYMDHLASLKLTFPTLSATSALGKGYGNDFEFGWPHAWTMNLTGNVSTQYQTGAASARPRHKQRARALGALKRAAEALSALASLAGKPGGASEEEQLALGREAHGVVQHHDSIPGTMSAFGTYDGWGQYDSSPDKVACNATTCMCLEDYAARMQAATDALDQTITRSLGALLRVKDASTLTLGRAADARNDGYLHGPVSTGDVGVRTSWSEEEEDKLVVVYNPLIVARESLVWVPMPTAALRTGAAAPSVVDDATGARVTAQIDADGKGIYFIAAVEGMAIKTYTLVDDGGGSTHAPVVSSTVQPIESGQLAVAFDALGLVSGITNKIDNVTVAMSQSYYEYRDGQGGPYVLVEVAAAVPVGPPSAGHTVKGPVFSEVWQDFTPYLSQRVRVVEGRDVVDVRHAIGTLPLGVEVVSRLTTNLDSHAIVHTDDSGLELHARGWMPTLPLSANYHSLVQAVAIRDYRQLSVMTSHTMGVSTAGINGVVEYMMHRRLNASDDQGPWPLNDTDTLVADVAWQAGLQAGIEPLRLPRASELEHPFIVATASATALDGSAAAASQTAPRPVLPAGDGVQSVQILNFFKRSKTTQARPDEYVMRLQNIVVGSPAVVVDVDAMFPTLRVASCLSMTLSLQQPVSTSDVRKVTLEPIDIVTLLITFH